MSKQIKQIKQRANGQIAFTPTARIFALSSARTAWLFEEVVHLNAKSVVAAVLGVADRIAGDFNDVSSVIIMGDEADGETFQEYMGAQAHAEMMDGSTSISYMTTFTDGEVKTERFEVKLMTVRR